MLDEYDRSNSPFPRLRAFALKSKPDISGQKRGGPNSPIENQSLATPKMCDGPVLSRSHRPKEWRAIRGTTLHDTLGHASHSNARLNWFKAGPVS